jgi:transcription elongation GreA/GreB family factor
MMSRAFVKEQEGDAIVDDLPERPQSRHPNYVTPQGLVQLEKDRAVLLEKRRQLLEHSDDIAMAEILRHVERDLRYLDGRIERAIYVDPANQPRNEVAFGAVVGVLDEDEVRHTFQIVGEDEADVTAGKVSWVSPLARALVGAHVGGIVTWERPAGDKVLRVIAIRYAGGKGVSVSKPVAPLKLMPAPAPRKARAPVKSPAKTPARAPVKAKTKARPAPRAKPRRAAAATRSKPKAQARPRPKLKAKAKSKPKAKAKARRR